MTDRDYDDDPNWYVQPSTIAPNLTRAEVQLFILSLNRERLSKGLSQLESEGIP